MLSQNALVKAKHAIESLYTGTVTVTEYQEYTKPNKSTGHREVPVIIDEPCRLSFSSSSSTSPQDNNASALVQNIKVFLAPDKDIKPGSKLTITQNGRTAEYKNSGEPALYATHQEINLELFKGWA